MTVYPMTLWNSARACERMCRAQRPNSSALYELVEVDCSQKAPVSRKPVLVQKIIHPTPHKSTAFFRLYDPSVVQINVPLRRPSTIHRMSAGVSLPGSITSHIHVPPQLCRNSQNPVLVSVAVARARPVDSLTTRCIEGPATKIGNPRVIVGGRGSSCDI